MTDHSDTGSGKPRKRRPPRIDEAAATVDLSAPVKRRKRKGESTDEVESSLETKPTPRRKRRKNPEPAVLADELAEPVETTPAPQHPSLKRKMTRLAVKYGFFSFLLFFLFSGFWIVAYRFINPPVTPLMILRHFQEEEDVSKRWRNYEAISPDFLLAVVAAEDQKFFEHGGFDWQQIQAALNERRAGGRLRGGSTISQQVAKNVFLWPGRSWIRKGLEVWFTAGIELCWSKQRILEVYVNVAEMGRGIYGVEAAAQHYYQKTALELTRSECALLATVLPDPRDRSPLNPTSSMRERQRWILGQMRNLGGIDSLASPDVSN